MKIGVLGLGYMACGMAWTIRHLPEAEPWAVASRELRRAQLFAGKYGFARAYGSYDALYCDPEVQLIYIATTHNYHYAQVKAALLHGKHVLCEKPLTVHAWEAEELVQLSQRKQLFLMEAQMLRFMPLAKTLQQLLKSGIIGDVISFTANYFHSLEHKERLMRPELGGGALLDIGVYPWTMADMILGHQYEHMISDAILTDTGVDAVDHLWFRTVQSQTASLTISIRGGYYCDGIVNGTAGYLILRDINHLQRIERYHTDGAWQQSWDKPKQLSDYAHELWAAIQAIQNGQTQCSEYPWETILMQMRLLDDLRKQWKVIGA